MNEEKAKYIINNQGEHEETEIWGAACHLEAIEKAKVLEDCLKEFNKFYIEWMGGGHEMIEKALSKWKEIK